MITRLVLVCLLLPALASAQTLGVLGDSGADSYRAEDNRAGGTPYAATTLNWVEQWQRTRPIQVGTWGTYPEPRRTDYAQNWARSGAIAADLPGQAAGLAGQIAAQGGTWWVIVQLGGNDIALEPGAGYSQIYSGALAGSALTAFVNSIIADMTSALSTLNAAGDARVFILTMPDPGPWVASGYPDPVGRQRVTDAVNAINAGWTAAAMAQGDQMIDLNAFQLALHASIDSNGNVMLAGETVCAVIVVCQGPEPHNLGLADFHAGTLYEAAHANLFLTVMNPAGFGVTPFTDVEMRTAAGIVPPPPPPPPPTTQTVTPSAYAVTMGTWQSGTLASLATDNNNRLVVRSKTSGTIRESRTELTFSGITGTPTRLDLTVRIHAQYGSVGLGIEWWNYSTGSWVSCFSTASVGTTESVRTCAVTSGVGSYLAGGIVRVRLVTGAYGLTHTVSTDFASLVATP